VEKKQENITECSTPYSLSIILNLLFTYKKIKKMGRRAGNKKFIFLIISLNHKKGAVMKVERISTGNSPNKQGKN